MALKIIWNNIIDEPTDVIVTPASRKPRIGTGLDKIIHEAAGSQLLKAREALGTIEPGVVKVTPSFGLKNKKCHARKVIHALGPLCERGKLNGSERPLLFGCYLQILCTAVSLGAETVSIPVMSSGKFGMPMNLAVDTAVEAIELFLMAVPKLTVKLVGIDFDFYEYARAKYSWITEARLDRKAVVAYRQKHIRECDKNLLNDGESFATEEESEYFCNLKLKIWAEGKTFNQMFNDVWTWVKERDRAAWKLKLKGKGDVEDREGYLLKYEDLEDLTHVSRRKIKRYVSTTSSESAIPPRDTLIAMVTAMKIPFAQLRVLMASCGYSFKRFGPDAKRDQLILSLCTEGKFYAAIECALAEHGMAPLVTS